MGGPSIRVRLTALLAVLLLLLGIPGAALVWMTSVPGRSHEGPLPGLTPEQARLATRLRTHVEAIASKPHNVGHPEELERSARHIENALAGMDYPIHRQAFETNGQKVRNIEIVIEPAAAEAATLVIGAHYDSWLDAPGANDNGTGTAAAVELARLLSDLRHKSSLRIRIVLFVNEEPPFFKTNRMGSLVHARSLKRTGEPVLGMLTLETLGFYSDEENSQHYPPPLGLLYPTKGDFVAFVGLTSSRTFVQRAVGSFREVAAFPSVGGTAPGFVQGIDWSDHWAYEQMGMPALMVTDTAPFRYPHYHTPRDTPDRIDYERLARVVSGLEKMIRKWETEERVQAARLAKRGSGR